MEILIYVVRLLFGLFLIYTLVYLFQWVVGLCAAVFRLERRKNYQEAVSRLLPDAVTREHPVTVIIPAHNEAACIKDTIWALLEEDYPCLQIIVVDDGSTDGTAQAVLDGFHPRQTDPALQGSLACQKVAACYSRRFGEKELLLIVKENGGKSDALNCGLNYCTGSRCVIVDADTQVQRGALRRMTAKFLSDPRTVVCAGCVGNALYGSPRYKTLTFPRKVLVLFQQLEYFRTFYMQRVLFDYINANLIVSGAFAMFDSALLRQVGGYRVGTIGEDMELTLRLHAFCKSQGRDYHISYVPEAKCATQVPFSFHDFYQQRRRWHIGMVQSLKQHLYMLGSRHYGWAGMIAGTFLLLYELMAPFIELLGLTTLVTALFLGLVSVGHALLIGLGYALLVLMTQTILLAALKVYGAEPCSAGHFWALILVSLAELPIFHPYNLFIKLSAFFNLSRHGQTWNHIRRVPEED